MIYMQAFWTLALLFFFIQLIGKLFKIQLIHKLTDRYAVLFFLLLGCIVTIAIVTKDPVSIAGIDLPAEVQWLGSLFLTAAAAWKFYLDPLKNRVLTLECTMPELKTSLAAMEKDMHLIKEKLLRK